jgi:hypothetical protein
MSEVRSGSIRLPASVCGNLSIAIILPSNINSTFS